MMYNNEIVNKLKPAFLDIIKNKGKPYLVGGCLRDWAMGIEISNDIDVEVHNISLNDLIRYTI